MTRKIVLELDDDDYDLIQAEVAQYQTGSRNIDPTGPTIIPDGESNLVGAIVAELIRDLQDYRQMWEAENPI